MFRFYRAIKNLLCQRSAWFQVFVTLQEQYITSFLSGLAVEKPRISRSFLCEWFDKEDEISYTPLTQRKYIFFYIS